MPNIVALCLAVNLKLHGEGLFQEPASKGSHKVEFLDQGMWSSHRHTQWSIRVHGHQMRVPTVLACMTQDRKLLQSLKKSKRICHHTGVLSKKCG